ncbi:MAG: hypothetical protein AAB288_00440, partial [Acidobacteriota bacterium]
SSAVSFALPSNVIQARVGLSWGLSSNDFGLKVYSESNSLIGESNNLNLPGLSGRREEVFVRNPSSQNITAVINHTAGIGFAQNVFGAIEMTRVEYPELQDLSSLSAELAVEARRSLLNNLMLTKGKKYKPDSSVSRYDLAASFVRAGLVPQYLASSRLFHDSKDFETRSAVESVQSNPDGKLFFDVSPGGNFCPNSNASRLVAAVAFVKAAKLDGIASTSTLPAHVADQSSIPTHLRGYVAVALQRGLLTLDGNSVNPYRSITRMELAKALNTLTR